MAARTSVASGLAGLVFASVAHGASYNDISIVDDDGKSNVGLYTSIAIGSDHLPIISYYDDTARALKVAHCEDAACASPATITVVDDDASLIEGRYSAIAIGADDLPVISYQGDTGASLRVAKCVESGVLSVNSHSSVHVEAPFGGFKQSGLGRDLGVAAMEGYTELKNVFIAE